MINLFIYVHIDVRYVLVLEPPSPDQKCFYQNKHKVPKLSMDNHNRSFNCCTGPV